MISKRLMIVEDTDGDLYNTFITFESKTEQGVNNLIIDYVRRCGDNGVMTPNGVVTKSYYMDGERIKII